MKIKNNDTWQDVSKLKVKQNNTWIEPKLVWAKSNGIWSKVYQPIPSNMIILYNTASYYGDICNGNNNTPNLLDRFVKFSSNGLSLGGTASHSGTSHGYYSVVYDGIAHIKDAGKTSLFANGWAGTESTHSHTTNSHAHGGTFVNANSFYRRYLIPTINNNAIYKNSLFFFRNALSDSDWLAFASYAGYYLYLSNTVGAGTGIVHSHDRGTIPETGTYALSATKNYYYNSDPVSWYQSHYHSGTMHSLSTVSALVLTDYRFYNYTYNSDIPIYDLVQLPINTVGLFTNSVLPYGWIRIDVADNYYSCLSNNSSVGHTTDGNSTNHGHNATAHSASTGSAVTNTMIADNTNNNDAYTVKHHTHPFTDRHTSTVDVTPPWVSLVAAYKAF